MPNRIHVRWYIEHSVWNCVWYTFYFLSFIRILAGLTIAKELKERPMLRYEDYTQVSKTGGWSLNEDFSLVFLGDRDNYLKLQNIGLQGNEKTVS